jgi:hypothetical protein
MTKIMSRVGIKSTQKRGRCKTGRNAVSEAAGPVRNGANRFSPAF